MPKIKTHSGLKKRVKFSKTGLIKRGHTNKRHILTKKDTKRKRGLRKATFVDSTNLLAVRRLVPYK
jgi:large subunit ribosomal protein L35